MKKNKQKDSFNLITYIEYDLFNTSKNEIDFLYDYSIILGKEKNDEKIIQWQIGNLDRLFKYGIDITILKKRSKEQNIHSYDMTDIIKSMTFRLQKHGKLAPSNEITRIFPKYRNHEINKKYKEEEDEIISLKNGENFETGICSSIIDSENNMITSSISDRLNSNDNNRINRNNIILSKNYNLDVKNKEQKISNNFYDKGDPFIDDELDNTSEDNELLFKLTLIPGNYTEEEIINNLKKNTQKIKKKKEKNIKITKNKKNAPFKIYKEVKMPNKILSNNIKDIEEKNNKNITIELSESKIEKLFNKIISSHNSSIYEEKEKILFIRKYIKIIKKIYSINQSDCISVLSRKLFISEENLKNHIEQEIFKSNFKNL